MKVNEILNTITEGENETVEFKSSFNKEAIETLTAFANVKGGCDSITIRTDLIEEVNVLFDFLRKHINKASIITGKAQRTEYWDYPLDALREILINMVVHRDYMQPGDSIVKIHGDFIEFSNPGALPKGLSVESLLSGNYMSSIRNKQIAVIFKEAGLIEKYGSGIKRIIKVCKEHGLPSPEFEELQHGFRVKIYKTTQKTTQKITTQDQILMLLTENPSMTRNEIAKALSKSPNTIKEHLSKLKTQKKIERIGSDRKGYWNVLDFK